MSFRARPNVDLVLAQAKKIQAWLELVISVELIFTVAIRHCDQIGESLCYGSWFDEQCTVNHQKK